MTTDTSYRIGKIFHNEIRFYFVLFISSAIPGFHQNRSKSRPRSRENVGGSITHKETLVEVDAQILRRLENHAGTRLPAIAFHPILCHAAFRMMETNIHTVNFRPMARKATQKFRVNFLKSLFRKHPLRNRSLVRYDHKKKPHPMQHRKRPRRAREQPQVSHLVQMVNFLVDDTIAV